MQYFKDTDTLYIEFRPIEIVDSRDLDEDTVIDLDAKGNICAMTMEHAKGKKSKIVVHEPETINVRAIREKTGMSQQRFCATFGISLGTLRHWEQGLRSPRGPARKLRGQSQVPESKGVPVRTVIDQTRLTTWLKKTGGSFLSWVNHRNRRARLVSTRAKFSIVC